MTHETWKLALVNGDLADLARNMIALWDQGGSVSKLEAGSRLIPIRRVSVLFG